VLPQRKGLMTSTPKTQHHDSEEHMGAVEGDRPTDTPNQGNRNGPGVDENGLPNDPVATCEDALGANIDETEGG
jgi:hypothetical protein